MVLKFRNAVISRRKRNLNTSCPKLSSKALYYRQYHGGAFKDKLIGSENNIAAGLRKDERV